MKAARGAFALGVIAVVCLSFTSVPAYADFIFVTTWSGPIEEVGPTGNESVFANKGQFYYGPYGLAFDPNGNLYVASTYGNTIVELDPMANESPFASGLNGPDALAFDRSGNLYVADTWDNTIWKFDSTGHGSFFASGVGSSGLVFWLACDSSGNLYELASSGIIEKYTPSGQGSLFANVNSRWGTEGLAIDRNNNLYVANHGQANSGTTTIMRFDPSGQGSVFAVGLPDAMALAFDSSGELCDLGGLDGTIEKFDSSGHGTEFVSGLGEAMGIAVQVPEPSPFLLVGTGMLTLWAGFRRKSQPPS